jgi:hypothetical protein
VEEFWQRAEKSGRFWVEEKPRLFKVVKSPVSPAEIPPTLEELFSRLFGFEFFEADPETGRIREFDEALGPLLKQRFHERIYDLAHEVGQVLRVLQQVQRQGSVPGVGQGARRFIYLATTTSELQNERDRIKRELIERGHVVLPDAPLPQVSTDIERAVQTCLEKCAFAIHLLGRHYGMTPEDQDLIRRLTPPTEKKALSAPAPASRTGAPIVYLICEARDEEAAASLEDYLFSQGLEVCLPAFDGTDADAEALHRENLLSCDAAIVYYGQAPRAWVDIKLREILKAPGYGRAAPLGLQAVYIAPPDDRRKDRFRSYQARVIQQPGEFAPNAELEWFAKAVKEARK